MPGTEEIASQNTNSSPHGLTQFREGDPSIRQTQEGVYQEAACAGRAGRPMGPEHSESGRGDLGSEKKHGPQRP